MWVWIIILSIANSILYRLGGKGGFKNAKAIRRFGCPAIMLLTLFLLKGFILAYWWVYILVYGITVALIGTYWDEVMRKDNFYFHSLGVGLAMLPYAYVSGQWIAFVIRAIILCVVVGLVHKFVEKTNFVGEDVWEEGFRGFIFNITLFFFR